MERAGILVVDDEPSNIRLIAELLKQEYDIHIATSGEQTLGLLESSHNEIDLILLDVDMPAMTGIEVLERIQANNEWRSIPVIFVTARDQEGDEAEGLDKGAVDYITKPIVPTIVKARIRTQLQLRQAQKELASQNKILEQKVEERTQEISHTQEAIIHALTSLAETRDNETGGHIIRTQYYVKTLAEMIRELPEYEAELRDEANINAMFKTAPLHDVGKVGIPDSILLKPGKLTDEEWVTMRTHAALGGDALKKASEMVQGAGALFFKYAQEIAYCHHEKWNGSGYPKGLKGDEIPVSARLMAIADVYDALISKRCYKDAFSHEKAISIMEEGKGQHFDPVMLDVFLNNEDTFFEIAQKYRDE